MGLKSWRILRTKFQILEHQREIEKLRSLAVATVELPDFQTRGNARDQQSTGQTNHDLLVLMALVKTTIQMNNMYVSNVSIKFIL